MAWIGMVAAKLLFRKLNLNGRQLSAEFLPSIRPRCANHRQSKYSSSLSQGATLLPLLLHNLWHNTKRVNFVITQPGFSDTNEWPQSCS